MYSVSYNKKTTFGILQKSKVSLIFRFRSVTGHFGMYLTGREMERLNEMMMTGE